MDYFPPGDLQKIGHLLELQQIAQDSFICYKVMKYKIKCKVVSEAW